MALLATVYRVLRHARQKKQRIHLSITNGRKTMAVYSMVAAQLLFGPHDKVWHMVSSGSISCGQIAVLADGRL